MLKLTSSAFATNEPLPDRYARTEENVLPPLQWSDVPEGTQSFTLIVEDPDAPRGPFRHAAIFDIPADRRELPEGARAEPGLNLRFGRNDFGAASYDGPEPPIGDGMHHYFFRLAALDIPRLDLRDGVSADTVWKTARRHLLEEAELIGTYER